jgi:hypothetical protein
MDIDENRSDTSHSRTSCGLARRTRADDVVGLTFFTMPTAERSFCGFLPFIVRRTVALEIRLESRPYHSRATRPHNSSVSQAINYPREKLLRLLIDIGFL